MEFVIGGISSCIAELITLPVDTYKVKCQLDRNFSLFKLYSDEKSIFSFLATLCNGLQAAMLRQITYGSIRYGLYPFLKVTLPLFEDYQYGLLINKLLSGSLAGAIASALTSPTDLVRIRMQGSHNNTIDKVFSFENIENSMEQPPKEQEKVYEYRNVCDAFSTIVKEEGITALYACVDANIARATVLAAAELASYDLIKTFLETYMHFDPTSFITHTIVSFVTSLIAVLIACPFDTARSKMMMHQVGNINRGPNKRKKYKNLLDCLHKIVLYEGGITALWSGIGGMFGRLLPHTVITFVVMEQLRMILMPGTYDPLDELLVQ